MSTIQSWKQFEMKSVTSAILKAIKAAAVTFDNAAQVALERGIRVVFAGVALAFLSILFLSAASFGNAYLSAFAVIGTAFLMYAVLDWIFDHDSAMFALGATPTIIAVWGLCWSAIIAGASTEMIFQVMADNLAVVLALSFGLFAAITICNLIVSSILAAFVDVDFGGELTQVIYPGTDPVISPEDADLPIRWHDRLSQRIKARYEARYTFEQALRNSNRTVIAVVLGAPLTISILGLLVMTTSTPLAALIFLYALIFLVAFMIILYFADKRHKTSPLPPEQMAVRLNYGDARAKFVGECRQSAEFTNMQIRLYAKKHLFYTDRRWLVTDAQNPKVKFWVSSEYLAYREWRRDAERAARRAVRIAETHAKILARHGIQAIAKDESAVL